ncbi:MAG TPA: hypothetical protein VJ984_03220 [Xanthomonadales bacterium]|nr:hypothetical protein [Xanthomonadales bacterium]
MSSASNKSHRNSSPSSLGRIANALTGRHWGTFAIELTLIVVGVIVALSIDDWAREREEKRSEQIYLASLVRDLDQMVESIQVYVDTETMMARASTTVLGLLADDGYEQKAEELRENLSKLGQRRTLRLVSATYADLTSTGNFQLIRSRDLREQLLRYFADVSRAELVVEKNNTVFIDNMFWPFMRDAGITWVPNNWRDQGPGLLSKAEDFYSEFLGTEIAYPTDAVFRQPADAEIWNEIRRMCFLRLRVSTVGLSLATILMETTEQLKLTIDAELLELNR